MEGHFRAFSFVDRIRMLESGRVQGSYSIPDTIEYFPAALAAEAVGQLAAVRIGGAEQVTAFEPVDTFRREIEDLCATIRGVNPPLLGPEEAVRDARILDRVTAAARGGLAWNGGST